VVERRNVAYAAIDLDWLRWFHVPGIEPADAEHVYLANVTNVVGNVRDAGVDHLIVALAVHDGVEVRALEQAALGAGRRARVRCRGRRDGDRRAANPEHDGGRQRGGGDVSFSRRTCRRVGQVVS
jgi:hypothetical protein